MLIAIFLSIFLAIKTLFGGGTDQYGTLMTQYVEDQIKIVMPENDQRRQALHELEVLKIDIEDLNERIDQDMKAFTKLIDDYHSTPADFDQQLAEASAKNKEQFDKMWSGRQALLSHIQPDEWKAILSGAQAEMQKKNK
jgi:hypothetical protein